MMMMEIENTWVDHIQWRVNTSVSIKCPILKYTKSKNPMERSYGKKKVGKFSPAKQPKNTEVIMVDGKPELVEYQGEKQITPQAASASVCVAVGVGWYPGKRELTPREQQQRETNCKVVYSAVVPSALHKSLDESRRANWIPPVEVEKMPVYKTVLTPAVNAVIDENPKEVAAFMDTTSREEKEKVMVKLKAKVLKKLPDHDPELVEMRLWSALFALLKDQGVSNRPRIFN